MLGLKLNSQMPRHLISDAHEWINEIPPVPIYYLAKPQQSTIYYLAEPFWRSLFERTLVPDNRCPQPVGPPKWELMAAVTTEDVERSLMGMKDGAPGPDGRKLKDVRAIPHDQLSAHFNLWLLSGYLLSTLREGETVLLPKVSGTGAPNEFRPIMISNIVVRCFHRIMAQQMEMHLPLSLCQKAFRRGDGIADLVWFMQTVIKHHQDTLCPLNIAFMDMKKAFDSVSQQSILVAAARLGVPPPFLTYLRELYGDAQTRLRIGTKLSEPIKLGRGVRQGDPMSVHLFNAVIDLSLDSLGPELGTEIGGVKVNHNAFADDIALIARSPAGLQALADDLDRQLTLCGLELSTGLQGKSVSIRSDIDGKAKRWIVYPYPYLRVRGELVPTLTVSQVYKYLGVNISPQSTKATVAETLQQGLSNISKAPLKPQQRLYIASCHLVPKILHQLTLTPSTSKYLRWLDHRQMRSAVRSWLKLPKDTSIAYLHARAVDGGLGLPLLRHEIPLMKRARTARMAMSPDPVVCAMLETPAARKVLRARQTSLNGTVMATRQGLRSALPQQLYSSVNGRGLAPASQVPAQHRWVTAGDMTLNGHAYVGAIKIRGNLVATALRSARGRPQTDIRCDCCGRPCPTYCSRVLGHMHLALRGTTRS